MRAHMTGFLVVLLSTGVGAAAPGHDVAFWRAIAHDHYTPPRGSDIPALALAKLEVLLSNDPQPSDAAVAARTALRATLKTLY